MTNTHRPRHHRTHHRPPPPRRHRGPPSPTRPGSASGSPRRPSGSFAPAPLMRMRGTSTAPSLGEIVTVEPKSRFAYRWVEDRPLTGREHARRVDPDADGRRRHHAAGRRVRLRHPLQRPEQRCTSTTPRAGPSSSTTSPGTSVPQPRARARSGDRGRRRLTALADLDPPGDARQASPGPGRRRRPSSPPACRSPARPPPSTSPNWSTPAWSSPAASRSRAPLTASAPSRCGPPWGGSRHGERLGTVGSTPCVTHLRPGLERRGADEETKETAATPPSGSTVDPRDEAGGVGAASNTMRLGDLLGRPQPAHRCLPPHGLEGLLVATDEAGEHRRPHAAGAHGVDPMPLRATSSARPAYARRASTPSRQPAPATPMRAKLERHVDDRPALGHDLQLGPQAQEHAVEVHRLDGPPRRERGVDDLRPTTCRRRRRGGRGRAGRAPPRSGRRRRRRRPRRSRRAGERVIHKSVIYNGVIGHDDGRNTPVPSSRGGRAMLDAPPVTRATFPANPVVTG